MLDIPRRIQLRRTKGWRKPGGTVVVARPTKWGNPWRAGAQASFWLPDYPIANPLVACAMDAADVVALYRRMLTGGPEPCARHLPAFLNPAGRRSAREDLRAHASRIIASLPGLCGRDLACWCPLDQPCHADVLLELANA